MNQVLARLAADAGIADIADRTPSTAPGARGIDQFLANADQLDHGLGSALVRAFVDRLLADPAVTQVQTDPSPDNARAIRCYQKAGFVARGDVVTPDGPALLMLRTRGSILPSC